MDIDRGRVETDATDIVANTFPSTYNGFAQTCPNVPERTR